MTVYARDIDCYVVDAAPLARAVHGFASSRPHQQTTAWLVETTGIPKGTIDNLLWRDPVTREMRPRRKKVELRVADALTAAIDRPELLSDGTLEAEPNRAIAKRNWDVCCGGCLTGVA